MMGAPDRLISVFNVPEFIDCKITVFKDCIDGLVPDLEVRTKKQRRATGQFYTPESLAIRLSAILVSDNSYIQNILRQNIKRMPEVIIGDPACGDGSFLMAVAKQIDVYSKRFRVEDKDIESHKPLQILHGYDIDLQALFICLTRLITAFPRSGWPKLELRDFLLNPPEQKFDAIIGNPPYKVNLDTDTKLLLKELYTTAEGEKDLYTFFIEGCFKLLKNDGQLILLTSHTYLVNHHCQKIRKLIFGENSVEKLLMLPYRFFSSAPGVLPVVMIARAGRDSSFSSFGDDYNLIVATDYNDKTGWNKEFEAINTSFLQPSGLRQSIVPSALKPIFIGMSRSNRLGDFCRVGVGIQESLKRDGPVSRYVSSIALTHEHRPVLRGREIAPFKINWDNNYIHYGSHLAYAGDEAIFRGQKILYQNIRNERLKRRLVATLDRNGFFPKNSISFILSKSEEYSNLFILGLLNCTLINAWFSGHFHSFHITVSQVRQIPLPKCDKDLKNLVESIAERLSELESSSDEWLRNMEELNMAVCCCFMGFGDYSNILSDCDIFLEQAVRL